MKDPILVTGAAGFIGSALCTQLLKNGENVIGIDNLNTYYSLSLKLKRLDLINELELNSNKWKFEKISIDSMNHLDQIFEKYYPKVVINFAAQAGVRYSLVNPQAYIQSNLVGFSNILECCRRFNVENLIYASSSSVYGSNKKLPFKESDMTGHPISLYAATKRSNELLAHSYSNLYGINTIGLRFFTVYGPWGRPDMAPMIFAKSILEGDYINIFNNGEMDRDFTYIDDVVEIISRCIKKRVTSNRDSNFLNSDPSESFAPYKILNVGNGHPIKLMSFIEYLEKYIGIKAKKRFMDLQPGDVISTHSDTSKIQDWIGGHKMTSFDVGIKNFVNWYKKYYKF